MAEDKLGKFLYEQGFASDDFSDIRAKTHNDDLAVVSSPDIKWRSVFFANERGRLLGELVNTLLVLCGERTDFSVSFSSTSTIREVPEYDDLAAFDTDPDQLELIRVEYVYDETELPEEEEELYDGTNSWQPPLVGVNFYSYANWLLNSVVQIAGPTEVEATLFDDTDW